MPLPTSVPIKPINPELILLLTRLAIIAAAVAAPAREAKAISSTRCCRYGFGRVTRLCSFTTPPLVVELMSFIREFYAVRLSHSQPTAKLLCSAPDYLHCPFFFGLVDRASAPFTAVRTSPEPPEVHMTPIAVPSASHYKPAT